MRGLVMDFAGDRNVWNIDNEYLFGPDFLVAPVTEYRARTWPVYLPAGTGWYDFYTGKFYQGGQKLTADAPLASIPLFVRAGAIVPTGPSEQYAAEKPNGPITLLVYPGANGRFDLYNDDGTSYGYARGEFTRIHLVYNDAKRMLTIGARQGRYPGMPKTVPINIRWIAGPHTGMPFNGKPDGTILYTGNAVTVRMPLH